MTEDFDKNIVSDPLAKRTITIYGHQFDFKIPEAAEDVHSDVFEQIKAGINKLHFLGSYSLRQRSELGQLYQFAFLNGKQEQAAEIIDDEKLTLADKRLDLIKLIDPASYDEFAKTHKTLMNQLKLMN